MSLLNFSKLTVIIITYNSSHCLINLSKYLTNLKNLIFVDNNSTDGTLNKILFLFPNAKLIRNEENYGYGKAANLALEIVKTPYSLILNPDCILNENFLSNLYTVSLLFPKAAIIAPKLINKKKKPILSFWWIRNNQKFSKIQPIGPCCVGNVSGAVMLLNMKIMNNIGFFDEKFFLYYEDEDLCRRVFEKKKEIIFFPEVKVTHLSRSSTKGFLQIKPDFIRGFHHVQSKLKFEKKYFGKKRASQLRYRLFFFSIILLLLNIFFPYPRTLSKTFGRLLGLFKFKLI